MLLVVDMLKGFLLPRGKDGVRFPLYCGKAAEQIVPRVRRRILAANRAAAPVVFLCDRHAPEDPEFEMFPPHCIRGTEQAEIVEELAGVAKNAVVIPKTRFSGFFGTDLDRRLARWKPDVVEVVGVCTNICVLYTVCELRARYIPTHVPADCVASFDRKAHDFALGEMKEVLGARVG
ncbi:MAG: cysteine hydrolase [Planctomycetes bacterium]|nr:cysteine hydrolase [Planctomycetota bacterium]